MRNKRWGSKRTPAITAKVRALVDVLEFPDKKILQRMIKTGTERAGLHVNRRNCRDHYLRSNVTA